MRSHRPVCCQRLSPLPDSSFLRVLNGRDGSHEIGSLSEEEEAFWHFQSTSYRGSQKSLPNKLRASALHVCLYI